MLPRLIMTTIAGLALGSTTAMAQDGAPRSTTKGLNVSVYGSSAALTLTQDRSTAFGGGLGVAVGYGFDDRIAIHTTTSGAFMSPSGQDGYVLSHVHVGGRYTFGSRHRAWAPHVALGASGRTAHFEVPESVGGGTTSRTTLGLTAGGGISYHLTPATSLDWSLRHTFGNLQERSCPKAAEAVRTCATSTRVNFGFSWYPFAG